MIEFHYVLTEQQVAIIRQLEEDSSPEVAEYFVHFTHWTMSQDVELYQRMPEFISEMKALHGDDIVEVGFGE